MFHLIFPFFLERFIKFISIDLKSFFPICSQFAPTISITFLTVEKKTRIYHTQKLLVVVPKTLVISISIRISFGFQKPFLTVQRNLNIFIVALYGVKKKFTENLSYGTGKPFVHHTNTETDADADHRRFLPTG